MWVGNEGGDRGVRLRCVIHRKVWGQSDSGILPMVLGLCETPCSLLWEREGDRGSNYYFIN